MGISIWQLIIIIVLIATPILVFGPVVKKAGFSRWWSLLLIVPVINLIMEPLAKLSATYNQTLDIKPSL